MNLLFLFSFIFIFSFLLSRSLSFYFYLSLGTSVYSLVWLLHHSCEAYKHTPPTLPNQNNTLQNPTISFPSLSSHTNQLIRSISSTFCMVFPLSFTSNIIRCDCTTRLVCTQYALGHWTNPHSRICALLLPRLLRSVHSFSSPASMTLMQRSERSLSLC